MAKKFIGNIGDYIGYDSGYPQIDQDFTASNGESNTSGSVCYDIVDRHKDAQVTIIQSSAIEDIQIACNFAASVESVSYLILENHNLNSVSASIAIGPSGGGYYTISASRSGVPGGTMNTDTIDSSGESVTPVSDGTTIIELDQAHSLTDWIVYILGATDDINLGQVTFGRDFTPSKQPRYNQAHLGISADGVEFNILQGGNPSTLKRYNSRERWSWAWQLNNADLKKIENLYIISDLNYRYFWYYDDRLDTYFPCFLLNALQPETLKPANKLFTFVTNFMSIVSSNLRS